MSDVWVYAVNIPRNKSVERREGHQGLHHRLAEAKVREPIFDEMVP